MTGRLKVIYDRGNLAEVSRIIANVLMERSCLTYDISRVAMYRRPKEVLLSLREGRYSVITDDELLYIASSMIELVDKRKSGDISVGIPATLLRLVKSCLLIDLRKVRDTSEARLQGKTPSDMLGLFVSWLAFTFGDEQFTAAKTYELLVAYVHREEAPEFEDIVKDVTYLLPSNRLTVIGLGKLLSDCKGCCRQQSIRGTKTTQRCELITLLSEGSYGGVNQWKMVVEPS